MMITAAQSAAAYCSNMVTVDIAAFVIIRTVMPKMCIPQSQRAGRPNSAQQLGWVQNKGKTRHRPAL